MKASAAANIDSLGQNKSRHAVKRDDLVKWCCLLGSADLLGT
jgi:hypothetical protein